MQYDQVGLLKRYKVDLIYVVSKSNLVLSRFMNKNFMFILIKVGRIFDKDYQFMVKILKRLQVEGLYIIIIIVIYSKFKVNIILIFFLKFGIRF